MSFSVNSTVEGHRPVVLLRKVLVRSHLYSHEKRVLGRDKGHLDHPDTSVVRSVFRFMSWTQVDQYHRVWGPVTNQVLTRDGVRTSGSQEELFMTLYFSIER